MTTPKRKSDGEHHAKNPHPLFLAAELPVDVEISWIKCLMVMRSSGSQPVFVDTVDVDALIDPSQIRTRWGGGRYMVKAMANAEAGQMGARTSAGDPVKDGHILACGVFNFEGTPKSAQTVEAGRVTVMPSNAIGSFMEHLPQGIAALGLLATTLADRAKAAADERRDERERRDRKEAAERAEVQAERDRKEKRDNDERDERRAVLAREQSRLDAELRARDDDRRAMQAAKDVADREDQRLRSEQQMAMFTQALQSRGGDGGAMTQTLLQAVLSQKGGGTSNGGSIEDAMKTYERIAKIKDDAESSNQMAIVKTVIEHIGPTPAGQSILSGLASLLPGSGGQPPMPPAVEVPQIMNGAMPIN